jgi:hypothetical protein
VAKWGNADLCWIKEAAGNCVIYGILRYKLANVASLIDINQKIDLIVIKNPARS